MENESLFFIKTEANAKPSAKLLFIPDETPTLRSARLDIDYKEGTDFLWEQCSSLITLTENSRIPFKTIEEMHPAPQSPQSMDNGQGKALFWAEGHVFHDMQAVAAYKHAGQEFPDFSSGKGSLKKSMAKLKAGKDFTLLVLGDSISEGYNASGFVGAPPFQKPYAGLVADKMKQDFNPNLNMINLSKAGEATYWGLSMIPAAIEKKPDLMIIAFGMNDSGVFSQETYISNIAGMITQVRAKLPDTEFILVSAMLGNFEWVYLKAPVFPKFRDALMQLEGDGVKVANLTSTFEWLLQKKSFMDITGNGLNHPNDFGHRIYAETILNLIK